jgi:hypothetical protein
LASNWLAHDSNIDSDLSGIIKFSSALKDNGSLASLADISDNNIGDEQEAEIKQICAGKSIKITL